MFDDLSDDPYDLQIAIQHELATKPWPYQSNLPVIDQPFEEVKWIDAVVYPF